jgi:flagellar motor switch protein FliM
MAAGAGVIARKVGSGRVSRPPIARVEDIGADFAKLLDERLRRLLRTVTSSILLDCEVRKLPRVLDSIPVPALLGVIAVRNAPASALITLSSNLIFHIVDLRLGGDSEQSPLPVARAITALDCALCRGFVETAIETFGAAVAATLGTGALDGMSLRGFEQNVGLVRIAPENADVLVLKLALDIGEAARSGEFDMVVPLSVLDAFRAAASKGPQAGYRPGEADLWQERMAEAVRAAPVGAMAVLARLSLDLGRVQDWRPGEVLALPPAARGAVELVLPGRGGGRLAAGRLGAMEGRKALKIVEPPEPALVARLAELTGVRP